MDGGAAGGFGDEVTDIPAAASSSCPAAAAAAPLATVAAGAAGVDAPAAAAAAFNSYVSSAQFPDGCDTEAIAAHDEVPSELMGLLKSLLAC